MRKGAVVAPFASGTARGGSVVLELEAEGIAVADDAADGGRAEVPGQQQRIGVGEALHEAEARAVPAAMSSSMAQYQSGCASWIG